MMSSGHFSPADQHSLHTEGDNMCQDSERVHLINESLTKKPKQT